MGDRAQIAIQQNEGRVYLYTHWHGSAIHDILKAAMQRGKPRWDDDEYLTRIIFSEMIKDDVGGETGFGIGLSEHCDLGHDLIVVDPSEKTVSFGGYTTSFEGYVA